MVGIERFVQCRPTVTKFALRILAWKLVDSGRMVGAFIVSISSFWVH